MCIVQVYTVLIAVWSVSQRKRIEMQKKNSVKERDTEGFRWEIRNISIFITATWKTSECQHPLQQATQKKLAWELTIIIGGQGKKKKTERRIKRESELKTLNGNVMNIKNTNLQGNGNKLVFKTKQTSRKCCNLAKVCSDFIGNKKKGAKCGVVMS